MAALGEVGNTRKTASSTHRRQAPITTQRKHAHDLCEAMGSTSPERRPVAGLWRWCGNHWRARIAQRFDVLQNKHAYASALYRFGEAAMRSAARR